MGKAGGDGGSRKEARRKVEERGRGKTRAKR